MPLRSVAPTGGLPTEAELRLALSRSGALAGMVLSIDVSPSVGSTNALALDDGREGLLVVAGEQTEGRGRHGSAWRSPPGGLYVSYAPPAMRLPARLSDLSPLAALAVAEAVDRALAAMGSEARTRIKWPNDLLLDGRKAGGILVQTRSVPEGPKDGPRRAVVGVGLNVNTSIELGSGTDDMPLEPTSLAEVTGRPLDLGVVMVSVVTLLLDHIVKGLDDTALASYRTRCETLGSPVSFTEEGRTLKGRALDVLPAGAALLVELETGELRALTGGEVRHLRRIG